MKSSKLYQILQDNEKRVDHIRGINSSADNLFFDFRHYDSCDFEMIHCALVRYIDNTIEIIEGAYSGESDIREMKLQYLKALKDKVEKVKELMVFS